MAELYKVLGSVSATTEKAATPAYKVLGSLADKAVQSVSSGVQQVSNAVAPAVNNAVEQVSDFAQKVSEIQTDRPGFRPQSLQEAGSNLEELMTKAGEVVTPSPETTVRALRYAAPVARGVAHQCC